MNLKESLFALIVVLAAAYFPERTTAQTTNYYWSGAGDGATWSQGTNWVNGIAPVNDGTTFQIYIGTGDPTLTSTPINISSSDHVVLQDQLFGPEWGETLNIYGSVNAGYGFCPLGDENGPKSTVNLYGTGSFISSNSIFIGDPFWFAGGPNVDFNLYDNSTISSPYLALGGHLNLYNNSTATISMGLLTGTPSAGEFGGISSDLTRWINLAGGKLILPTGNIGFVKSLIGRGIFLCYGEAYDTNAFTMVDDGTHTTIYASAAEKIFYSTWTSATIGVPGNVTGTITLPNSHTIGVSYSGEVAGTNNENVSYWAIPSSIAWTNNSVVGNVPSDGSMIRINDYHQADTILFSEPVRNPVMLWLSIGGPSDSVTYCFQTPFRLLSSGPDYWTSTGSLVQDGAYLTGLEGSGSIQFLGTVSSITWTNTNGGEFYQGFTIGIPDQTVAANLAPILSDIVIQGIDIRLDWLGAGGSNYVIQAATNLSGSNLFSDISPIITLPGSGLVNTNYLDAGVLTNSPARFYRIRSN